MNVFQEVLAGFSLFYQVLPVVAKAFATVQADTGKPWEQVAEDVINHLTPGQPNAPGLGPDAAPAA
jgi:hypothetical protein